MKVKNGFVLFWDDAFSNFDKVTGKFVYRDKEFYTSEQAFMYHKALTFNDAEVAEYVLGCRNPQDAKHAGRMIKDYDDAIWENLRYGIMLDVCMAKFTQSEYHKAQLLKYGALGKFVEASPYDKIWGIGLDEDHPNATNQSKWKGRNLLGKVLDEVYTCLTAKT